MALYAGYEKLTRNDFAGDEIKWGCLCWELWLENDYDLCQSVLDWSIPTDILVNQLILCQEQDTLKNVDIITPASNVSGSRLRMFDVLLLARLSALSDSKRILVVELWRTLRAWRIIAHSICRWLWTTNTFGTNRSTLS